MAKSQSPWGQEASSLGAEFYSAPNVPEVANASANSPSTPCDANTGSGFTIDSDFRQHGNHRHAKIMVRRSAVLSRSRGLLRSKASSRRRRQRLPAIDDALGLSNAETGPTIRPTNSTSHFWLLKREFATTDKKSAEDRLFAPYSTPANGRLRPIFATMVARLQPVSGALRIRVAARSPPTHARSNATWES